MTHLHQTLEHGSAMQCKQHHQPLPTYRWSSRTYQQIQALYPNLTHQNSVHIDTYGKNVGKKNTWPEVLINVLLACTTLLHCLNLYFQHFTNLLASFPGLARLSLAVQNLCRRVWSILSRTWSVLHSTEIQWYLIDELGHCLVLKEALKITMMVHVLPARNQYGRNQGLTYKYLFETGLLSNHYSHF